MCIRDSAVEIARRGAIVVAVDVSVAGVQRGQALAQMAGQSSHVHAASMDAHALGLADASVDLVFGAQVLHHLDCAQAGAEIGRVLPPGGRAAFIENSARSPLLMWARRHLVGRTGIRRYVTAADRPLDAAAIRTFCRPFGGLLPEHFPPVPLATAIGIGHVSGDGGVVQQHPIKLAKPGVDAAATAVGGIATDCAVN